MVLDIETKRKRGVEAPASTLETEIPPASIGIVLLVIAMKRNGGPQPIPFVWTTRENMSKPETEKVAGQISLPAETRKQGESQAETLLGTIAEFTNDDAIVSALRVPRDHEYPNGILVKGNPVDVAVLFYDGPTNVEIRPVDLDEVSANGWRSFEQLRAEDPTKLRSTITKVLEFDERTGFIQRAVERFQALGGTPLSSVAPALSEEGFSIRGFNARREQNPDVVIPSHTTLH